MVIYQVPDALVPAPLLTLAPELPNDNDEDCVNTPPAILEFMRGPLPLI